MTDLRRAPRLKTLKGGSITLPTGIVECVIRNVSDTGALIELKEPTLIPSEFLLIIKPELTRRQCQVVRRSDLGIALGVKFI